MLTRRTVNFGILAAAGLAVGPSLAATELKTIDLPAPWKDGGKPLAQAVWARRSIREFADKPVPIEVLSNLLWTACGVNRPATADRTVPSWRHAIESEIVASLGRADQVLHRGIALTHLGEDLFGWDAAVHAAKFTYRLNRNKLRTLRRREGRYLLVHGDVDQAPCGRRLRTRGASVENRHFRLIHTRTREDGLGMALVRRRTGAVRMLQGVSDSAWSFLRAAPKLPSW